MTSIKNRRDFLRTIATATAIPALGISAITTKAVNLSDPLPYKFKLSLNAYSFNSLFKSGKIDLFGLLDFCAECDFDGVNSVGYYTPGTPAAPSDDFVYRLKRKAFDLGINFSGTGVLTDFANPDPDARKTDINNVKQWIVTAVKMGIPLIHLFAGNNKHQGFSREEVLEWMVKDIRECCEYGRQHGIIVALQNHNDFIKTAEDVNQIFKMVDSDWLGLNLDIGSYRQGDPYVEIEKNIKYAVTWQIKEKVWIQGKEAPTDFVKLFRIIKKSGYRGFLPLETLGAGDPYQKVPILLENVRNALKKS